MECAYLQSPLGWLEIVVHNDALIAVAFIEHKVKTTQTYSWDTTIRQSSVLNRTVKQLEEYFAGKRTSFDIPIEMKGTPFQQQVWRSLEKIPYGETRSYKDIAENIHNPKAVRAVGRTNGINSIAIVIPCHRVIGKNGSMTGYASGIWRKEWLLKHEQTYRL